MALDAANFISELSIVDPPGTDPLSQGDDQIRTTKRAVQQSFPNIGEAVNLTALQMNLAAIKNEVNIFTLTGQTFTDLNATKQSAVDQSCGWDHFDTGGLRWRMVMRSENAGGAFGISRHDAIGTLLDRPWECDLLTGVVDFLQVPTVLGTPLLIPGEVRMLVQGSTLPGGNWFVANGTNGTVALQDRILGAQGVFFGTQSPFLDVQTDVGPATGSTVLSEGQMPVHNHEIRAGVTPGGTTDVEISAVSTETVVGGNRGNLGGRYIDNNSSGNKVVNDRGSSQGHQHTIPELECNPKSNDAFQVMPFTYFMIPIQYVP